MKKWKLHFVILEINHWSDLKRKIRIVLFPSVTIFLLFTKACIINIFLKISILFSKMCYTSASNDFFIYDVIQAFIQILAELFYCNKLKNNVKIALIFIRNLVTLNNYILKINMQRTSERIQTLLINIYKCIHCAWPFSSM